MISDMTGFADPELARDPKRIKANAALLLSLAAAPTFAIMALLTAVHSGMPDRSARPREMDPI
jgi:hypothetical protein